MMKPMKHQLESLKFLAKNKRVCDFSDAGCVSADTEYLTPTGWKRFDAYTPGDKVAQFHPATREIEFVAPLEYIKRPCETMIAIAPIRGASQRLSHEHRVLYYLPDGTHHVMSAQKFAKTIEQKGANHFKARFCTTFSVRSRAEIELADIELRLMVAVIADGHFPGPSNAVTIRLKKTRKIQRLREILIKAKIDYVERQCGGQPDFQVFRFNAPHRDKVFGSSWWMASQPQLEVIADELCHWDSCEDSRPSNGTRFSSFEEASADFAQYAFSAAKRTSSKTCSIRDRRDEGRGVMAEYVVHARADDKFVGPGRKDSIYEAPNPEGFKYCFEVPSSFLLLRHNGYIFATGNTGKTCPEIIDFASRRRKKGKCLLVLAPKSLLDSAWAQDFHKFAPDMRCSIAYASNRDKAFEMEADAYITNIDAVNWLVKQPAKFWKKFDTIVIDESTCFKHSTSGRSRNAAKIMKYFEYRRVMTGTPTSNGITDIWHQVYLMDDGARLGTSFYGFRNAACVPTQVGSNRNMIEWTDRPGIEAIVANMLKDIVIRHVFEECVDIPENYRYAVPFKLSPSHMKKYRQMELINVLPLKKQRVTAVNAAVVAGKLLQIASGAVYDEEGNFAPIDSDRYALVLDLVEQRKHSIVFFAWAHQRDELIKEAVARGLAHAVFDGGTTDAARTAIVKGYQEGKYRVLFAHPQSAGHGLTLVKGTATIWASPTHNLEHFLQGLKRVHRIGQTEKTETIVVVAEGTIDEHAWRRLNEKDVKMTDLLQEIAS